MPIKIFSALIAVVLFFAYLLPVVFKLKEVSLGVVILIGSAMMLTDLWQSFKGKD
jgi:hypothetical protein